MKKGLLISAFLSPGREHGRKMKELTAITGLSEREVRQAIQAERKAGSPILSDNASGYFLVGDSAEAVQFARSMRHRAGEILKSAAAVEKAAGLQGV